MPEKAFTIGDSEKEYDVPCVFQIWIKKDHQREFPKQLKPNGYKFVKKNEAPDFSLRRVGVYAGMIYNKVQNSEQSHYYVTIDEEYDKESFYELYKNLITFNHNNTVGPKSISKQEFIEKINLLF